VVLCVVETGVWTADKQPVALLAKNEKNDWIAQVIPQQAIKAMPVTLYSKNSDPAAEVGVVLFFY
jgi:hypothetical protein